MPVPWQFQNNRGWYFFSLQILLKQQFTFIEKNSCVFSVILLIWPAQALYEELAGGLTISRKGILNTLNEYYHFQVRTELK